MGQSNKFVFCFDGDEVVADNFDFAVVKYIYTEGLMTVQYTCEKPEYSYKNDHTHNKVSILVRN